MLLIWTAFNFDQSRNLFGKKLNCHLQNSILSIWKDSTIFFHVFNPPPKFYTFPNWTRMQTTISNLIKMAKFSKQVQNTVGKGEIALYEQFLLFPQCFQDLYCRHIKPGLVWERVMNLDTALTLYYIIPTFKNLEKGSC